MSDHEKAADAFSKWASDIGFSDGPEQDPEEIDQAEPEVNEPSPLGDPEIRSENSTRNSFANYVEEVLHFW